jgi:hypothetical protein
MPYDERQLQKHREALAHGDKVDVTLLTHEKQSATGFIRIERLDAAARGRRARRWLITCLIIAPVAAVCPPHFPWLLLTITVGIIGYVIRGKRRELVTGGEARCPKCEAFQLLEGGNAEFPMAHFCSECGERSLVRPVA